jgi:hypothetical protein
MPVTDTAGVGQWSVGRIAGIALKSCRRARVQDNTTSWISRSPTLVSTRTLRRVWEMSSAVTGFAGIACKLVKAFKYRMQLRERVEGAMSSLRKLNGLRCSEQPLDKTIQLLAANPGDLREALSAFRDLDPG